MIDTQLPPFREFEKIHRFNREVIVTEKLDGTNAQVFVSVDSETVAAGSRNRWLTVDADNFGFARWVEEHRDELRLLGPGHHYGEWWGAGIQRRYGLKEKRFSLFNTHRWGDVNTSNRPPCCHVVPVLWSGPMASLSWGNRLADLAHGGSVAAPGFMEPEGICIFHVASNHLYKATLGDDGHKGASR